MIFVVIPGGAGNLAEARAEISIIKAVLVLLAKLQAVGATLVNGEPLPAVPVMATADDDPGGSGHVRAASTCAPARL